MDRIVTAAESILRRHPAPGLPLARLAHLLRDEGPGLSIDCVRLRRLLEAQPERFRVLELWTGALRGLRPSSGADADRAPDDGAWVAVISDPTLEGVGPGHPVRRQMRESVRWLARSVDPRSTRGIARWHRILAAEARTRDALEPVA